MNQRWKSILLVAALGAAFLLGGVVVSQLQAVPSNQPNMDRALEHLRAAKASLEKADANKGGHRVKAIAYVNSAIDEVRRGINVAK